MSSGKAPDDQRLPRREGVDDHEGPRGVLTRRMRAALLALIFIAAVGVIFYFAGRALWQEPIRSGRQTLPEAPQAADKLPADLPQPASSLSSELKAPPPVARMLEAQSRNAAVLAKQQVEKQLETPASTERRSTRAPEFRPPRRVIVARRAVAQPQRILYASRVVQLGEYSSRREAEAAHARLVRVYPYLKTLPRTIKPLRRPRGAARAYYLRLRAYSPDHARVLCRNLLAIGRGCAVLPEPS